ncbi:hypothetical protein IX317_000545 [Fusobacterium sp. DD29]|nr:hypothetical protein [Fusobacterium sp. DD45]MBR8710997.1 hypothetical protein [Fusobacterium sp. DD28]MBR8748884.1 hypothetical protein [Fusobacterium sp. DD29]MBR8751572.1 hypothetical protein [Fusobacterium sp. DD26]MBR8761151.1 hypothetical protein [Fusobacterium sp. DD25]MBR8767163.1 hypothetical protein [Fusobacterium sp. DD43]MBR8771199.1 hypothetical protein [Fusobacterium sp. DD40]MBR8775425.1 hypothetical protein [Fusobacterium sp. DD17]MBR8797687.1 hypothetical protein [Fusoba
MKKLFLAFFVVACGLIAGCGKDNEAAKDTSVKKEKVVVVSQGSKPKSLDPAMYNEIPALTITRQIFNTLLRIDDNGNIVPELAESYEYCNTN